MSRRDGSNLALLCAAPIASVVMMATAPASLWVPAAFTWWFGLAALPGLALMLRLTSGTQAALLLVIALCTLGVACGANLAALESCGAACRFGD